MPIYNYKAKDSQGKVRMGMVDAKTNNSAVSLLRAQGLYITELREKKVSIIEQINEFGGIPTKELVGFTRQLATMISSGLTISRALEVLSDQTTNPKMRKILMELLRDIEGGIAVSSAMSSYPSVFSPTYTALVKAGEASGKLDEILIRLATTLEAERDLQNRFKAAMIYPAIVFAAMIGVFVLMMVFVIPKLAEMYESLDVELPVVTSILISVSGIMSEFWYVFLLGFIGLIFWYRFMSQTPGGRDAIYRFAYNMPVFGPLNRQKDLADFTRTLSLLIASAIPIVEALNIVSNVINFPMLKVSIVEAAAYVERGNSLSEYMRSNKVFPPLIAQMASVGEETGQMDSVLDKVADYYASETENAVKGLSSALEPIILIVLGGLVGLLIVSIITPIYKITNSIA